jgi:hypothetical protein
LDAQECVLTDESLSGPSGFFYPCFCSGFIAGFFERGY